MGARLAAFLTCGLLALPSPVAGQVSLPSHPPEILPPSELPVALQTRVRITRQDTTHGPPRSYVGRLEAWGPAGARLASGPGTVTVPFPEIMALEASRGRHSHAKTGAIVGGVIGLGLGLMVGGIGAAVCENDCDTGRFYATGAVLGTLALGGIGAGIGALVRSESWEDVPLTPPAGGAAPGVTRR